MQGFSKIAILQTSMLQTIGDFTTKILISINKGSIEEVDNGNVIDKAGRGGKANIGASKSGTRFLTPAVE